MKIWRVSGIISYYLGSNGEIIWEFNSIKNLIAQKSSIEQLILVEAKFKEYAEDAEFQELKYNMKDYVEKQSFENVNNYF